MSSRGTTLDTLDTNRPGPGRTWYKGVVQTLGKRIEKAVSGNEVARGIGGEDRTRSIGLSQCHVPTGSIPNSRGMPATVNAPTWPHLQPSVTTSITIQNGYTTLPTHYPNPQYSEIPVAPSSAPYPPPQVPTVSVRLPIYTTVPTAVLPSSNAEMPPIHWVPIPTSSLPTVIIVPSVPTSGSQARSRSGPSSPARASARERGQERDPEVLVSSANHRFHAFFEIRELLETQPHLQENRKITNLVEDMRREVKPFRVEKRDGVMHVSRKLDDKLYHELNAFVDAMDPLIGDFIFEVPDFIFSLSKRHRNDIFKLFESPRNMEWIDQMKLRVRNVERYIRTL